MTHIKMQKRIIFIILILVFISVFAIIFFVANSVQAPIFNLSDPQIFADKNSEEDKTNFSDFFKQKKLPENSNREVVLFAAGDISYSRGVGRVVKREGDTEYPFLKVASYIKSADISFANLETTITPGREIADFEMIFRSDPGLEKVLQSTGFSVLSLANNHMPDFGEKGISDTIAYLDAVGLKHAGAGENSLSARRPAFLDAGGYRFAFLAFNDSDVVPSRYSAGENRAGTALMRIDEMIESVKTAQAEADFVIVSMHSGTEYVKEPNDSQIAFARSAIDAGAEIVLGHHPHVVQTMEKYQGKYIFYSLGNFVFDQPWSENTKDALMLKAYFSEDGIVKIEFMPARMKNFAQPEAVFDEEAERILERLDYPLQYRNIYFWDYAEETFVQKTQAMLYSENYQNPNVDFKSEPADQNQDINSEIYFLKNGVLELWKSSKLIWKTPSENLINDFVLADIDNDAKKELIVLQSDCSQESNYKCRQITVWKKSDAGFINQWQSEKGNFSGLELLEINGEVGIVADIK